MLRVYSKCVTTSSPSEGAVAIISDCDGPSDNIIWTLRRSPTKAATYNIMHLKSRMFLVYRNNQVSLSSDLKPALQFQGNLGNLKTFFGDCIQLNWGMLKNLTPCPLLTSSPNIQFSLDHYYHPWRSLGNIKSNGKCLAPGTNTTFVFTVCDGSDGQAFNFVPQVKTGDNGFLGFKIFHSTGYITANLMDKTLFLSAKELIDNNSQVQTFYRTVENYDSFQLITGPPSLNPVWLLYINSTFNKVVNYGELYSDTYYFEFSYTRVGY